MNRRIIAIVLGIFTIIVLGASLFASIGVSDTRGQPATSESDGPGKTVVEQLLSVAVIQPVRRVLTRKLTIPATLRADERADLYAKTSGYITMINVDIGSRVRKGDVLLNIDVPEMADELRQCEAVLEARRAKVHALAAANKLQELTTKRKRELAQKKAIPQQELDETLSHLAIAKANVKVAESEVAVAKADVARLTTLLKYTTITAPFDGVIATRNFDPGSFVRSATGGKTLPLFRLARTDRIRLVMEIPEPDAQFVHIGTEVEIHVRAGESETIRATITRTAVVLNSQTRTMRAEVDIDNNGGQLVPGMYVQAIIKLETTKNALMIPSKSIRVRGQDIAVLVVRNGIARSVAVKIGYDDGIWVEIVSGLEGNEQIIVLASSAVAPGTPVKSVLVENTPAVAAKD